MRIHDRRSTWRALARTYAGASAAVGDAQVVKREEIVIVGERRSAIKSVAPLATLDSKAIGATGATNMSELMRALKPVATSADGGDPIFLLNSQRTSGYEEIASLPPEALDKVEVLPETEALKYGYPPTRRVLNFIMKRSFRQVELRATAGMTTRRASSSANANFGLTRLHKDSRLSIAIEARRTTSVRQYERNVVPDPDILFDGVGNVTGMDGGEIDPALSQAAGQVVTVAPVPLTGNPSELAAYVPGANSPRLFDLGPYRTLSPDNRGWKAEAVLADRVTKTISGSLQVSAEQSTDRSVWGPGDATLIVPASNPFSPFANTVLIKRYLIEAEPLRNRQTTTTLHSGGTLRGAVAGWKWDLTAVADQKTVGGLNERNIDVGAANAAIAAGANPFEPLDPSLVATRLVDHASLRTRKLGTKLVANNAPLQLPAGDATVTATVEAERLSTKSVTRGANPFDLSLARNRWEAAVAIDVPIASRANKFLQGIGDLSLNASYNARRVSGIGTLYDRTAGLAWSPFKGVQLLIQDKRSGAAPDMEKLASPIIHIDNAPVFDFATGRTEIVALTLGGNPDLRPERRHVRSATINLKPFPKSDIRISATYEDAETRDQVGDIYALTPMFEAIFRDRFVRDASGRLVSVTFQPTNFYRGRQRTLNMTLSANGAIGKAKQGADGKEKDRPRYYGGMGPSVRFANQLRLRPGTPVLDLLRGDTVSGGGAPRAYGYYYAGVGYLGKGVSIDGWFQSGQRVAGSTPASDLTFSPIFKLNVGAYLSVHHFLRKQEWTRHMQLKLDVSNATDARQHVRDANGRIPNRFQQDISDPIGRTVKLTLRKLL